MTMPIIGFVILSHGHSDQLHRLVAAIDREYDRPPIACHHDFGQAPLDVKSFGENVSFVQPNIPTSWGKFSIVEAVLKALSLLYVRSPDWFILLSAADYPVMSGTLAKKLLADSKCDAFIDARPIDVSVVPACLTTGKHNPKLDHFDTVENRRMKRLFYVSRQLWLPIIRVTPKVRFGRATYRPDWEANHPYKGWPCYYGDFWFMGNRSTAEILLNPTEKHWALRRHLRSRTHTDETFFQTIIMNEPGLRVCRDNKRFAEWNGGGAHPILLDEAQLDEVLGSGAFFARKFQRDAPIIDKIDKSLMEKSIPAF